MNRPPYMPEAASLIARLPDMGSALHDSCIDLVREQTVEAVGMHCFRASRPLSTPWCISGKHWLPKKSRPMLLSETLFFRGQALGKISQDQHAGGVTFKPKHGHTRLAGRTWKSIDSCQRAVLKQYIAEGPRD
jgi:hypothetical protein